MSTEIYYFSGTGNSLVVAREIAAKTNGKLVSIPNVMRKESIAPEAEVIGIVFPVFYATNDCGIPLVVGSFVSKLENLGAKYVFAVCTCGYMPGATTENLRRSIESRGGKLVAGFTLRMSSKNLSERKQEKMCIARKGKLDAICEYVNARNEGNLKPADCCAKSF